MAVDTIAPTLTPAKCCNRTSYTTTTTAVKMTYQCCRENAASITRRT